MNLFISTRSRHNEKVCFSGGGVYIKGMETTSEHKPKNWPLWLGLAIPVVMILFVAASIYLPRLWAEPPQYDFIYMTGDHYVYQDSNIYYVVQDGKLIMEDRSQPLQPGEVRPSKPIVSNNKLFIYDVSKDEAREVLFAQVKELQLDSNVQAPDGFTITQGSSGGLFPFGGGNGYNRYLKKGSYTRKLDLPTTNYNYYDFRFLGWIKG